jgi:DNA repair exonuclease SbcCD ATPase subunit
MFLSTGTFTEFTRFLQIACWIILPVLLVTVIITTWRHRRDKKKNQETDEQETLDFLLGVDPAGENRENTFVLFDHSGLIRQYKDKLSYNHARYIALKHDYKKLERDLHTRVDVTHSPRKPKNNHMENKNVGEEQKCLADLLEEKKAQVEFLQTQLEQRIRNYHQSERNREEMQKEFYEQKESMQKLVDELDLTRKEVLEKEEAIRQSEELVNEKHQALLSKQDHVIYLENVLQEAKQQNQFLDASLADQQDLQRSLQEKLDEAETRVLTMEQKIGRNNRMLQKLHRVLGTCISDDAAEPPVIELKPVYIKEENHNWVESQ